MQNVRLHIRNIYCPKLFAAPLIDFEKLTSSSHDYISISVLAGTGLDGWSADQTLPTGCMLDIVSNKQLKFDLTFNSLNNLCWMVGWKTELCH